MSLSVRARALRGSQGFTLVELIVSASIFVMVILGMGSFWVSMQRAFDFSSNQSYVQRVGTQIQEEMQRRIQGSEAAENVNCGPNGFANMSLMVMHTNGTVWCYYEYQDGAFSDPFPMLYRCRLGTDPSAFVPSTSCQAGTKENLLRFVANAYAIRTSAVMRVANTRFFRITCMPGSAGACGDPGRQVTRSLVDVRFDITDGTLPDPSSDKQTAGVAGQSMRFGFALTVRN